MTLSVVTTLYKSELNIQAFYDRITDAINVLGITDYELIFVNDGSPDKSLEIAINLQSNDSHLEIIDFSKNFGHHQALMAGLKHSSGTFVFLIDSDLEEPPELLVDFYQKIQAGNELNGKNPSAIYGVQEKRKEPFFRRTLASCYYFLFDRINGIKYPKDVLTVRLMTKEYVDALKLYSEKQLELFVLFVLVGFEQEPVLVDKSYKGSTSYTIGKLLAMAMDSITSSGIKPIRFISGLSFLFLILTAAGLSLMKFGFNYTPGQGLWFGLLILTGGILAFCVSIAAMYFARLKHEIKERPGYIIRKIYHGRRT